MPPSTEWVAAKCTLISRHASYSAFFACQNIRNKTFLQIMNNKMIISLEGFSVASWLTSLAVYS